MDPSYLRCISVGGCKELPAIGAERYNVLISAELLEALKGDRDNGSIWCINVGHVVDLCYVPRPQLRLP